MDNISKLLNGFMKSSPPPQNDDAADIKPSTADVVVDLNPLLSFNHMSAGGGTTRLPAFNDMLASPPPAPQQPPLTMGHHGYGDEPKQQHHQQGPLSPIEKWLFEEAAEQVVDVDLMDLSDACCSSVPMMF
jgi:myb proto-oncogene protein